MPTLRSALVLSALGCLGAGVAQAQDDPRLAEVSAYFADAVVVGAPEIVDCTLSGGTQTECFRITLQPTPQDYTPGPWCPRNIADGEEAGGIWLDGGEVHDVTGAFIESLAMFYDDTNWQLFDPETGDIRYTGTLEACQAAARPNVAEEYQNYCVECLPEYMPEDASMTFTIPLEPQDTGGPNENRFSGAGIAYNGVRFDAPAPVDAILGAYTVAPFDDCGGHVNTNVGYHYHAVTDCLTDAGGTYGAITAEEAEVLGPQIGIAMDGYQIFPHTLADGSHPEGLDACNGRVSEGGTYYYHAGAAGSNAILPCLSAETGCASSDAEAVCDASVRPPRP